MKNKINRGFELKQLSVRLTEDTPIFSTHKIDGPEAVYDVIGEYLSTFDREVVAVIFIASDGTPIACSIASMGALNEAYVHPREIFKAAILANAQSIIMCHNHPSGSLYPSKTDTIITDRMIQAGEMIGIPLVDHIIVGGKNEKYFSFKEKECMNNNYKISLKSDYEELEFVGDRVAEKAKSR